MLKIILINLLKAGQVSIHITEFSSCNGKIDKKCAYTVMLSFPKIRWKQCILYNYIL